MDLLQSQIKESCNLALPEGLKDLMSDISREVLRSQPNDIIQFIVDYLKVLLEVREKMTIACHLCNDTFKCYCDTDLYNDLKAIGLGDEDIDSAIKIIEDHFEGGNVKENTLLIKLAKKLSIEEIQLNAIQEAVQKAFKRNLFGHDIFGVHEFYEVTNAVHHTLDIYRNQQLNDDVLVTNYEHSETIPSSTSLDSQFDGDNLEENPINSETQESHDEAQHQTTTTGKVKFIEEKVIFEIQRHDNIISLDDENCKDKETDDGDMEIGEDIDDNNDKNYITDNAIEEVITTEYHDDTNSSIDEDFIVDPEHASNDTI